MMLAKLKKAIKPNARVQEIVYDGFTLGTKKAGALVAQSAKNCACKDGVLSQTMGMQSYSLNGQSLLISPTLDAQFFSTLERDANGVKKERVGAIAYAETAYLYNENTSKFVSIGTLYGGGGCVTALDEDGGYVTMVSCDLGMHQLRDGGLYLSSRMKAQRAICVCGGRVFVAVDGFWLAYSAPYQPNDFTESANDGGKIALRSDCGKIVGLTAFKNKLCVLYEYGISTLETAGSARSFVRKDFAYGGGKILGESLCVGNYGGERAYFLAENGVYRFDGAKVDRICKNFTFSLLSNTQYYCGAAIMEDTYFITYMNAQREWKTVAVDLESGEGCEVYTMRGLFRGEGCVGFQLYNTMQKIAPRGGLPIGELSVFTAAATDFSIRGSKTLQSLRFCGEGSVIVEVTCDGRLTAKTVNLTNGEGTLSLCLRGKTFGLTLKPLYGTKIRSMTAKIQSLA